MVSVQVLMVLALCASAYALPLVEDAVVPEEETFDAVPYGNAKYTICGGGSMTVNSFIIPDPLILSRADNNVEFSLTVNKGLSIDNFDIVLEMKKKVGVWIPIPCISGVGSCRYDDICLMMSNMTQEARDKLDAAFGRMFGCPFTDTYAKKGTLPAISASLPDIAKGQVQIKAQLVKRGAKANNLGNFAKGDVHICIQLTTTIG